MVRSRIKIRTVQVGAVCSLVMVSVLVVGASAKSDSSADTRAHKVTSSRKANSASISSGKRPSSAASRTRSAGKAHSASSGKRSSRKKSTRVRGQQKIDSERAHSIQEALIREHYLDGEPTGSWDSASEEAMRRYQEDHGWQSKTVPDARALIRLGLGPSKDHLLNPDSAMTTVPDLPKADTASPASHSAPTNANPASTNANPVPAAASAATPTKSESPSPQ